MTDYIPLERTPDVQAKLASGTHIVEMDYRRTPMVERLVAVADIPDAPGERPLEPGKPITVAEARKRGLIR